MAFDATAKPVTKGFEQEVLEEGLYPARLARIIELGDQEDKYGVKTKVVFAFTLPTEHIVIEGEKKQRMMMTFPLNQTSNPDATIMKYMKALGGTNWESIIGKPCMIEISNKMVKEVMRNNITGVVKPMAGMNIDMPDCDSYIFDFENPDKKVFDSLSEFRQGQIKGAMNYEGSALQEMLEGALPVKGITSPTNETDEDSPI